MNTLTSKSKFILSIIGYFLFSLLLTANYEKGWLKDGYKCIQSLLLILAIYPALKIRFLREIFLFLMSFNILCFYYYTSLFGAIDAGTILSLLETNSNETTEFLKTLDFWLLAQAILFALIASVIIRFIFKNLDELKLKSWKLILPLFLGYVAFIADSYKRAEKYDWNQNLISHIKFLHQDIYLHYFSSFLEYKRITVKYDVEIKNEWSDVEVSSELNDVYILILGESARRDAYTLYGQAAPTTPALADTRGLSIVSQAIAPAPQTRESLIRILALNDKKNIQLSKNIIDLAKSANIKTFWISNQSKVGENDTLITAIANRADQIQFLNYGHYNKASTDNFLLKNFPKLLEEQIGPTLYVFHTMGSHSYFCARVWKKVKFNFNNNKTNCYYNSIHNSYLFIEEVREILKLAQKSYKGIFLSDHGLIKKNKSPYFVHGTGKKLKKEAYLVPFIFFDDEDRPSELINKTYYLRDFTHTFAHWIGIKAMGVDHNLSVLNENMTPQKNYVLLSSMQTVEFK